MANRVARYQADRTNQKLYFCRIYCELAEETEQKQLADAHLESAILHLYGGYLAFLQEIARYYQLKITNPTLMIIADKLAEKTQISPEIVRLRQLSKTDFLSDIEQAWQHVNFKPISKEITQEANQEISQQSSDSNRLPTVDVMANETFGKNLPGAVISVDMVRQWRTDLLTVIEDLRAGMVEF
ncbi:DUF6586 family protein [Faucicola boevrei]|uniref:DUF6586 family protein n=1 Tax=Faucicola boevrei TaxID=346665 RepID=UPI00036769A3|nr:DUF6586 family protein [Moraxella boevrei]